MKWVLILIWSHNNAMMGAQFGPFADQSTCNRVKAELTRDMSWGGTIRASCALSGIDPAKLPQVEVSSAPKKEAQE